MELQKAAIDIIVYLHIFFYLLLAEASLFHIPEYITTLPFSLPTSPLICPLAPEVSSSPFVLYYIISSHYFLKFIIHCASIVPRLFLISNSPAF